jgi:hypothetical protein
MKMFLTPNPNPPYNLMTRYPAYSDQGRDPNVTDAEFLQFAITRSRESGDITGEAPVYIVEDSDLPGLYFFEAWEWIGAKVQINMPKARMIHMNRIRAVRDLELAALDVPYMRAVETGDNAAQAKISKAKQLLRDIPSDFDITTDVLSPVQLKNKWPEGLPLPL